MNDLQKRVDALAKALYETEEKLRAADDDGVWVPWESQTSHRERRIYTSMAEAARALLAREEEPVVTPAEEAEAMARATDATRAERIPREKEPGLRHAFMAGAEWRRVEGYKDSAPGVESEARKRYPLAARPVEAKGEAGCICRNGGISDICPIHGKDARPKAEPGEPGLQMLDYFIEECERPCDEDPDDWNCDTRVIAKRLRVIREHFARPAPADALRAAANEAVNAWLADRHETDERFDNAMGDLANIVNTFSSPSDAALRGEKP